MFVYPTMLRVRPGNHRMIARRRLGNDQSQSNSISLTMGTPIASLPSAATRFRYCHVWGRWLVYDGKRWRIDDRGEQRVCQEDHP